jgi:hypothetical protein
MRFKDLRKKIEEAMLPTDTYGGYVSGTRVGPVDSQDNAVDSPEASVHQLTVKEINRLNTFVGAMEDKCYIDPAIAVNNMKSKLQSQGISFEYNMESALEDGTHVFPLKQFGGRKGFDGTSYNPIDDDGITHRLGHGLDLIVSVMKETNGLTRMSAKIAASNGNPKPGASTGSIKPSPSNASMQQVVYNKNPFTNPTFASPKIGG